MISIFSKITAFIKNRNRWIPFPKRLTVDHQELLKSNSPFYRSLSLENQKYFEHRVLMFIEQHDFIGREGVEITERIKILLASIAISISFGYREYLFSKLDRVIVYPKDYFSLINQEQHKGETNPRYKTLVLSWKHFEEGIKMEHDNLNLGIHEFTHALHFSFLSSSGRSARYFKKHYRAILKYLEDPKERKKLIDSNYLRAYAFENQYEFLAVLVEHFFETEAEFKRKLPTLHLKVEKLLRYSSLRNS